MRIFGRRGIFLIVIFILVNSLLFIGINLPFGDTQVQTTSTASILWNRTIEGSTGEAILSSAETQDGDLIFVGVTGRSGKRNTDALLLMTDSLGNTKWNSTFGASNGAQASDILITDDGGFLVTGFDGSPDPGEFEFWLIKITSSGNILWNKTYFPLFYTRSPKIIQTPDDGFLMIGNTFSDRYRVDLFLLKTDPEGIQHWNRTIRGNRDDYIEDLAITTDNEFVVTGNTGSFGSAGQDGWVVKTDVLGNPLWNRTFGGPGTDGLNDAIILAGGGMVFAGQVGERDGGQTDFLIIKTDNNGNELWSTRYGGLYDDSARSLIEAPDGGFLVLGDKYEPTTNRNLWLVSLDADGQIQWNQTIGIEPRETASDLLLTSDGGVLVVGQTGIGFKTGILLIKFGITYSSKSISIIQAFREHPIFWPLIFNTNVFVLFLLWKVHRSSSPKKGNSELYPNK